MTEFMRNSDAFTWAMEADPGLRSTIVTVFLLDRAPDWDDLLDRFDRIGRTLPMFRNRVVESPAPAPPRWETAPDFDIDYHMRRVTVPEPGDLDTVLEMARLAEMDDFDRARPLWEVTLVEGLADGGAALLCKLHHALTDGVGGVQIAMVLFDLTEEPVDRGPMPPQPQQHVPTPLEGLADTARYDVGTLRAATVAAVRNGPRLALRSVVRPVDTAKDTAALAASVYRTVRPINRTGSPIMKRRSLVRRLGVHEVPLRQLREAAHVSGGSLNDAFLAGITGGLRLYHDHHQTGLGDVHVNMPVSLREDGDSMGGNLITLMRFDVPAGLADPAERIRQIHARAGAVRHERSLPHTQLIAGALNLVPRWFIASILKHVDVLASDVPGLPVPVYIGGAAVRMQYAFGPTIGAGVNVTLMTYVDTCALGINVDTGAIPDYDLFHDCLVAGFDEVLALAP